MSETKKISATLIDFVSPMLTELGSTASKPAFESILRTGALVWNACVMDHLRKTTAHEIEVISHTNNQFEAALIQKLFDRKKSHFAEDLRGITGECVEIRNGNLVVKAEARHLT